MPAVTISLALTSCGDPTPAADAVGSTMSPTAVDSGAADAPEVPAASATAVPLPSATAPPVASATPTADGEPTDAELEQALRDRTALAKEDAVWTLCSYRNQRDQRPCKHLRPKSEKSLAAHDRDILAMIGRVSDPARRAAWKKAWARAADHGVVEVPPAGKAAR